MSTRAPGRALGVDVGTVRVGLAISDPDRLLATPHSTLAVEGAPGDDDAARRAWLGRLAARVAAVAREASCETVVVGLPRALSGRSTSSTALAREFVTALRAEASLEVTTWDERLSSVEAERVLVQVGRRREARREERDRVAATIVLQGWLDADRRARQGR